MIRTRLVWLGLGFSVTGAAISQFIWRDLWVDRYALLSDVKKLDALQERVSELESLSYPKSNPGQAEG
ncbi:hypothetical protein CMV_015421 [Castanea mollissima]|uniref:Uncharacterized protein n=2 Tax=Fagaceae TaxID=3503 RepID=A0A8J4R5A1_9ROSI|nr:hypothetical protein CMV_015421 [Castanea mollissima]KAK4573620.1 hypothetical protein RGQ29_031537 [Quercus rubra]KAK4573623.1 hypothetical protein RGQ29_031539 [Quercus rubra]